MNWFPAPIGVFQPWAFAFRISGPPVNPGQACEALHAWRALPQPDMGRVRLPANAHLLLQAGSVLRFRVFCGEGGPEPSADERHAALVLAGSFASVAAPLLGWGNSAVAQEAEADYFLINGTPATEPGELIPQEALEIEIASCLKGLKQLHSARPQAGYKLYSTGEEVVPLRTWLVAGQALDSRETESALVMFASRLAPILGWRAAGFDYRSREIGCWWSERRAAK